MPTHTAAADPARPLIFVSYKREDLPRIGPILQHLDSGRHTLWIDKKIPGGVEWDSYIEETIKKSSLVLLFLSRTAVESKHVRREVKFADRLDKPILSVMLEPVDLGQGLEMLLTQFQMIDATRDDFYPLLTRSLASILEAGER
jgi:serine/threonine-protein kinase